MSYWKEKVLPKIKKYFDKPSKKKAAAESTKSFDESKAKINKEFEEKKGELHPKVIEIYEASSAEIKVIVKERKASGLKKHSAAVQKFLDELAKIEFPGSKHACEASSKYGPALVSTTVFFIFEKVSTFIPVEEKPAEAPVAEPTPAPAAEEPEKSATKEDEAAPPPPPEECKEVEAVVEKKEEPAPEPSPAAEKTDEAEKK
ncbi:plasma membrane-associated cation-binding protein 1 [Nymphaea colorata]|nr:plasma membrane-associated cation-binding protein 1 [Nymphaea colorata]XP_049931942.1 plasma membrane-associated cation-binding protein 1 [Nymphaea colorata]